MYILWIISNDQSDWSHRITNQNDKNDQNNPKQNNFRWSMNGKERLLQMAVPNKFAALAHLPPSRLPPPGQNLPGNSRVPSQLQMSKGGATTTTMPTEKTRRRIQRKDEEEEEEGRRRRRGREKAGTCRNDSSEKSKTESVTRVSRPKRPSQEPHRTKVSHRWTQHRMQGNQEEETESQSPLGSREEDQGTRRKTESQQQRVSQPWKLSIYLFIYSSIYLSIYLAIYLSIYLSIY